MQMLFRRAFGLAALTLMSAGAAAQVGPFGQQAMPSDVRISVGVSIPLGGPSNTSESESRLELSIAPEYAEGWDQDLPMIRPLPLDQPQRRVSLLRFNLGDSQELSFAGQPIHRARFYAEGDEGDEEGRTPGQKVLRGAAVLGGLTALAVGGLVIAFATTNNDEQ